MSLPRNDSTAAIRSLAMYDDESGGEEEERPDDFISGSEDEAPSPAKRSRADTDESSQDSRPGSGRFNRVEKATNAKVSRLVSYGGDDMEEEDEEEKEGESDDSANELGLIQSFESSAGTEVIAASRSVHHKSTDEIQLPPEPPGRCSKQLQEKINQFYEKMHKGKNLNNSIQRRKDFRNPSIYEKLIEFCHINEKGTNYPPELYDPAIWGKESYYDELARAQKVEMDKREKEKKDRTKVEFVTGTAKKSGSEHDVKRKSKWDAQPQVVPGQRTNITTSVSNPPVVSVSTSSSGSKTTVISAIGTIKKPK